MMQDDGIHPNAAGVRKMAETVAKVIDPEAKIEQRPFWMMR
jgi:lysophospholipase L1-like esterase